MSSPVKRADTMPERAASGQCVSSSVTSTNSAAAGAGNPILSPSPARSTSSRQAYTTQVVKAMFGGCDVGEVVQDFSCSFERKSGRLYVSTVGLFYYSNLFGFEKRIRINYDEAIEIKTVRTTSLSVLLKEGEEYIFRSFLDRGHVLDIISRYHSNTRGANEIEDSTPASNAPMLEEEESRDKSVDEVDDDVSMRQESPVPDLVEEVPLDAPRNVQQKSRGDSDEAEHAAFNIEEWEERKQQAMSWEPLVANLNIACKTADQFFGLFLADNAANSMDVFSKAIGDENVSIGRWKTDDTTDTSSESIPLTRMVQLERKAGVSTAKVKRRQTYQRYGIHACLRNETSITGIKGVPKDAFVVEDVWLIEGSHEEKEGVNLNVRVTVNFSKSTNRILKSIIMNRTMAETKDWYRKYSSFVRKKMHQAPIQEEIIPAAAAKEGVDWLRVLSSSAQAYVANLSAFCGNVPSSVLVVAFAIIAYRLKCRVAYLEAVVADYEQRLLALEKTAFDEQLLPTEL